MTEKTVVLYPSLGVGHLTPMAQLAKAILRHGGVAVTIAVVDPPERHAVLAATLARLAAVIPSITVHLLPIPPCASSKQHQHASHPIMPVLDALRAANPALRAFLASRAPAVDALVVDMFCTDALDVAAELAIPAYFFYPSAAGDLAVYLQIPDLFRALPSSLKELGKAALSFAGVPPVRALDMPDTMQDWESDVGSVRLRQLARMPEAAGILVNSFQGLESRALRALRDGDCLPGRSTPKIYCVGPLVDGGDNTEGKHACLEWMDGQPKQSVVFLCFGSMGAFTAAQLKETARGLERSGHRFLWAVRSRSRSPREEQSSGEPDLEALLPDGFLEGTRGRGLVLRNWAPQTQVLRHEAVGAFVTHCGWNSVLEAVMSGVPMICWPLYAEQRLNKVHVVEEMKLGVVMEGYDYDEELVMAEEVEAKVRLVMESEEGKQLRERTAIAKEMAADAIREGGSSHVDLGEFLRGLGCK